MSADVVLGDSSLEASRLRLREVNALVTLYGTATVANIRGGSDVTNVKVYTEAAGQPTPVDSGANFGTLDSNADPTVIGVLVLTGDAVASGKALRVVNIEIPSLTITSGTMTGGTPALKGASSTGVTASGNIAFTVSCAGLDLDAGTANHSFNALITYVCSPQNVS